MDRPLYSLHLFAGAGGGILADILAGVQPVCAVELEPYPQRVLSHRFPGLPVWDDVQTFRADNPDCADAFAWMREHRDALVVAGGFPCQDISCAGKGGGVEGGERSGLWREFARILREIRPRFVFVENSPMLVHRGLERVLGDLAACGYDARWQVLAAGDVGARHLRERIWIAAARHNRDEQLLREVTGVERGGASSRPLSNSSIPDSASPRCRRGNEPTPRMGRGATQPHRPCGGDAISDTPRARPTSRGGQL